jgi:hypothetical protein
MAIDVKNPFDATPYRVYDLDDPEVGYLLSMLEENGHLSPGMADDIFARLQERGGTPILSDVSAGYTVPRDAPAEFGENLFTDFVEPVSITGDQLYTEIRRSFRESRGQPGENIDAVIFDALEELGYDGFLATEVRAVPTTHYTGYQLPSDKLTVFSAKESDRARYLDDADNATRWYAPTLPTIPERSEGYQPNFARILTESAHAVDGNRINNETIGSIMGASGSAAPRSIGLVRDLRGWAGDTAVNMQERGSRLRNNMVILLGENSMRMKRNGFKTAAKWLEKFYPHITQRIGHFWMPVSDALKALPDAPNSVVDWGRRMATPFKRVASYKAPKSWGNILGALRREDDVSRFNSLNIDEKHAFKVIRSTLNRLHAEAKEAGVIMGEIKENYFPQVWDINKLAKTNGNEFVEDMATYLMAERSAIGTQISRENAVERARSIYNRLAFNDGLYVPAPIGAQARGGAFDHADYQRLIRLDDPRFRSNLDALEKYLVNDIETVMLKYIDGMTRRIEFGKKFGPVNHGLYDYMEVAQDGIDGIASLLSRRRVNRRNVRYGPTADPELGDVHTQREIALEAAMPFENRDAAVAVEFAKDLVVAFNQRGELSARAMLESVMPDPQNISSKTRMNAIIDALHDFRGVKGVLTSDTQIAHLDQTMRIARRQPAGDPNSFGYDPVSRKISSTARAFNSLTLLSYTTLTSVPDLVLPLIRSGEFRGFTKAIAKLATDPDYRRALKNIGVSLENLMHERLAGLYNVDVTGRSGQVVNSFFQLTGLTAWTNQMRRMGAAVGYEMMRAMQEKGYRLYRHGVPLVEQSSEFRRMHRQLSVFGGEDFINPSKNKARITQQALEDDEDLRRVIVNFTDKTIFQPNGNDIPVWAQSPWGAMVFQLKSFPVMMGRLSKDVMSDLAWFVRDARNGEVNMNLLKRPMALATIGPAAGMAALTLKDFVQMRGGEEGVDSDFRKRSIGEGDSALDQFLGWYFEGVLASGGMGFLVELIHDASNQADNGYYGMTRIASAILGPTFSTGMDGMFVAGAVADGLTETIFGDDGSDATERRGARAIAGRVPIFGGNRAWREWATEELTGSGDGY